MYGLLITARMNERLHNAVHRCRWRLDPLCVLLQTIRQPRCMGCFYLRPVIDVLNCPLRKTGHDWLIPRHSRTRSSMTKRSTPLPSPSCRNYALDDRVSSKFWKFFFLIPLRRKPEYNKSFVTFASFPFFPIIKINLNGIREKRQENEREYALSMYNVRCVRLTK